MNLPSIYNKAQVAFEYYKRKNPEREYTVDQARKQFLQDKNIDKKVILNILSESLKSLRNGRE